MLLWLHNAVYQRIINSKYLSLQSSVHQSKACNMDIQTISFLNGSLKMMCPTNTRKKHCEKVFKSLSLCHHALQKKKLSYIILSFLCVNHLYMFYIVLLWPMITLRGLSDSSTTYVIYPIILSNHIFPLQ